MDQAEIETLIKNIDIRTKRIEQLLPTFATKDDLKAFAAHADLTFATKDDVREDGERTRRHFDTVAEQMKNDIALIAEGHKATRVYVDGQLADARATLESYDKRIMKLEAKSLQAKSPGTGDKPKRRSTRRDPS